MFFKREEKLDLTRKQELKLKDLFRYGINGILVNKYSEIPEILHEVELLYKRSHVFISGAAEVFDEFDNSNNAKKFIHKLSRKIAEKHFKIVSGFGFNVGSSVINGVLEHIFSTNYQKLDNYLKLMPFPQFESGEFDGLTDEKRKLKKNERNKKYRDVILSEAGIAIFIFGNKKDESSDGYRLSSGMEEEFNIAIEKGLKPIPIGATGYLAKKLYDKVMLNFNIYFEPKFYHLKSLFENIGSSTSENDLIIDSVVKIIIELNKY